MTGDSFWVALALMLVLEGLLPFIAPRAWKDLFSQLLKLQDGQLRFYGLCSVLGGLALLWWLG